MTNFKAIYFRLNIVYIFLSTRRHIRHPNGQKCPRIAASPSRHTAGLAAGRAVRRGFFGRGQILAQAPKSAVVENRAGARFSACSRLGFFRRWGRGQFSADIAAQTRASGFAPGFRRKTLTPEPRTLTPGPIYRNKAAHAAPLRNTGC